MSFLGEILVNVLPAPEGGTRPDHAVCEGGLDHLSGAGAKRWVSTHQVRALKHQVREKSSRLRCYLPPDLGTPGQIARQSDS